MGSCLSTSEHSGNRVGSNTNTNANRPTRSNNTRPLPKNVAGFSSEVNNVNNDSLKNKTTKTKLQGTGSTGKALGGGEVSKDDPKMSAAKAAELRNAAKKQKNSALHSKLQEERSKNRTSLLGEISEQKRREREDPLVFD